VESVVADALRVVKFPVPAFNVEEVVTPELFLKLKVGVADDVV
jgi:hypothetical protein